MSTDPTPADLAFRPATPDDAPVLDALVRDAFWNLYRPGATEHLIWHRAVAGHSALLPGQALVAEADGADGPEAVGCVMTTRAHVEAADGSRTDVAVLGPIAVRPDLQRRGLGLAILGAAIATAREAGERAILLFGDPAFYSLAGFVDASGHGITTADGGGGPFFMALELRPGALDGVRGRLLFSELYEPSDDEVDAFDARFPPRAKEVREGQL
ncbi:GNAT family N-acetyltransferase [Brachybacterium huguangmaarense]